jgi:hypothetical protein
VHRPKRTFDKKAAPEGAAILRQKKALNPPFRRVEVAPTGGLWRLGVSASPFQRTRERAARGRTGIVEDGDAFLALECLPGFIERHLRIKLDRVQRGRRGGGVRAIALIGRDERAFTRPSPLALGIHARSGEAAVRMDHRPAVEIRTGHERDAVYEVCVGPVTASLGGIPGALHPSRV